MRVIQTASATLTTRYFHTDHSARSRSSPTRTAWWWSGCRYDAWGKRRNPNGTDDATGSITSQTTRGFTGEEELSVGGLVHLNGRVYDPLLARMTSADPTVTDPMNPQGWNRYSYVGNDPLAFTDPDGYSFAEAGIRFLHRPSAHFNPIARALMQDRGHGCPEPRLAGLGLAGASLAFASAAGGAMIVTGISAGNLRQTLKAGLIAGVTGRLPPSMASAI